MTIIESGDGRSSGANLTGEELSCSQITLIANCRCGDVQSVNIRATKSAGAYIFARRSNNPQQFSAGSIATNRAPTPQCHPYAILRVYTQAVRHAILFSNHSDRLAPMCRTRRHIVVEAVQRPSQRVHEVHAAAVCAPPDAIRQANVAEQAPYRPIRPKAVEAAICQLRIRRNGPGQEAAGEIHSAVVHPRACPVLDVHDRLNVPRHRIDESEAKLGGGNIATTGDAQADRAYPGSQRDGSNDAVQIDPVDQPEGHIEPGKRAIFRVPSRPLA